MPHTRLFTIASWAVRSLAAVILLQTLFFQIQRRPGIGLHLLDSRRGAVGPDRQRDRRTDCLCATAVAGHSRVWRCHCVGHGGGRHPEPLGETGRELACCGR